MSEVVRDAIENRQRIKQELVLIQEDFLLNEVCISLSNYHFILSWCSMILLYKYKIVKAEMSWLTQFLFYFDTCNIS